MPDDPADDERIARIAQLLERLRLTTDDLNELVKQAREQARTTRQDSRQLVTQTAASTKRRPRKKR